MPDTTVKVPEEGVPEWLQRALGAGVRRERSARRPTARQVFHRLAGCWTYWGWKHGYFDDEARRPRLLRRDVLHAGARRWPRPNSPQWFNTGLHWAYGIDGPAQGHYFVDPKTGELSQSHVSAYERPQPHACFIQS